MSGGRGPHFLWEMRPYFRQVAGQLLLGSLAGIVMNTAIVLPPILLGQAIDAALAHERGDPTASIGWALLLFVAATGLTEATRIVKRRWLATANARIRTSVRADALRGVLAWPMARVHTTPVGDVMARITGDVDVMGAGVREFTIEIWDTVLFSISMIVAMLMFDAGLTALALVPVPVAMLVAHATGRWVHERTTAARAANAVLTAALHEQLNGVRVLRLFGRAATAVERIEVLSRRQADANLAVARLQGGLRPAYTAMMTAGVVLLVWQGGERVVAGALTLGAFVAYLQLFLRFVERGFRVPQLVNSIQRAGAAYARLRPLLAPPLSVAGEPPRASFQARHVAGLEAVEPAMPPALGRPVRVTLEGVTFRYPGASAPALRDVSLDVPAGAFVGVTGAVASGKSALARAVLGLYPLEGGRILLDGRPLADVPRDRRAAWTGYLPQDPFLFSGSVRENVMLTVGGDEAPPSDADERRLATAVERAALDADLRGFSDGLDTQIGELGIRLSGGQRQRVALARGLASPAEGRPALLVLDDPYSAVDLHTEAAIAEGLRAAYGPDAPSGEQATVVICSHRLATFPLLDHVIVLDGGEIVEQGTHATLLAADGLYARIFHAQHRVETGAEAEDAAGAEVGSLAYGGARNGQRGARSGQRGDGHDGQRGDANARAAAGRRNGVAR